MAYTEEELKKELESKEYEYGFYTDIESDTFPKGINEEIVMAMGVPTSAKGFVGALEAVRAAGHVVAICTGRNRQSLESLLDRSGWHPADLPKVLHPLGGKPLLAHVIDTAGALGAGAAR